MSTPLKVVLSFFIILPLCVLHSCSIGIPGEGEVVVQEIDLDLIRAVEISSSADVVLHYGQNQKVEVHGQQNMIDLLSREVSGGSWDIGFTESVSMSELFEIHITLPVIESIEIDGSGDLSTATPMKGDELEIEINGSGDVSMDINVKQLETSIDGSGDVTLKGFAAEHTVNIDGSGDVDARDVKTKNAAIESNGSGDVKINVSGELDASCSGSGSVIYYGEPDELTTEKTGRGSIKEG